MGNEIEKCICKGKNNIDGKCCDSRGADECKFCEVIKNEVSKKIINTLCKFSNNTVKT